MRQEGKHRRSPAAAAAEKGYSRFCTEPAHPHSPYFYIEAGTNEAIPSPLCPQLLILPPASLQHKRVCSREVKGLQRRIGEEMGCVSLALISVPGGVPCPCTRAHAGTEGG